MEYKVFLGKYRVPTTKSAHWWETQRGHLGVINDAEEIERGAKVDLEFVPLFLLGRAEQEELKRAAGALQQIRHVNIPTLHELGVERDEFVCVTEHVRGLTAESWIAAHGPMPIAPALGIALQVVRALRIAAQHDIHHSAIHPGNLVIVPGQTTEDGSPLVKVLRFLGPNLASRAFHHSNPMPAAAAPFASPEQLAGAAADFRSETYSLGATLWFLISGTSFSRRAEKARGVDPRQSFGKFAGVPEGVRSLLASMLSENRNERPSDPIVLEEEIRACLSNVPHDEMMKPVVAGSPNGPTAPDGPAGWRRFGMNLLVTAGAALIVALVLRGITKNPTAITPAEVPRQPDVANLAAAQNTATNEKDPFPTAMNFSVVSPSYQDDRGQIRVLEHSAGRASAQDTSMSIEPAPPAEGPDLPIVEVTTARRGRSTKTLNSAPPIAILPGDRPAVAPLQRKN